MVQISSDNSDTEKRIISLCDLLEKSGSYISPEASIVDVGGATSVFVSDDHDSEFLFKLRHDFLIPYDHFDFDVEGKDIVIAHDNGNSNPQHLSILEQMIGLYNDSGKFSFHVNTHPLMQSDTSPELVECLMRAREGQDLDIIAGMLGKSDFADELALLIFFKSRLLNCRLHSMDSKHTPVLIPVMEFMNHHYSGATFENLYSEKGSALSVEAFTPVSDSEECFTRYGRFDALDSYMHYGFADHDVPYVRSVPLRVDLDGVGTILIGGNSANVPIKNIPTYLQDLAFYFPRIHFSKGHKVVELSHLFIPNEKARFSMRRILAYVIQSIQPQIDESGCSEYVGEVERQVLDANLEYYKNMKLLAAENSFNTAIGSDFDGLSEMQRKKIVHYKSLSNP